ncbi:MAG TPA: C4-type zinc ribbon domain-containing protein [Clostridia bacterium]|nr:C4-type zinc ribbon domain-containing protein [Clostridia bacterium]
MSVIELLWQYQQLDMEVDKLETELKNSEERQKALFYKSVFYKSQQEMQKIEDSTDDYLTNLDQLEKEIDALSGEFSFEIENEEDLELAKKCAVDITNKLNKLDKRLKEIVSTIEGLEARMNELSKKAQKAKAEYDKHRELFNKKNQDLTPAIKKAVSEREKFEKGIPADALAVYKNIKSNRGMPISLLEDGKCSGCNMSLPSAIITKVKNSDRLVECENCGKILYAR